MKHQQKLKSSPRPKKHDGISSRMPLIIRRFPSARSASKDHSAPHSSVQKPHEERACVYTHTHTCTRMLKYLPENVFLFVFPQSKESRSIFKSSGVFFARQTCLWSAALKITRNSEWSGLLWWQVDTGFVAVLRYCGSEVRGSCSPHAVLVFVSSENYLYTCYREMSFAIYKARIRGSGTAYFNFNSHSTYDL